MALVGASQLLTFADRMDELSQRAQSVLQRYDDHNQQAHASGTFQGAGGDMNLTTSAEVHEAQMKIQTRFRNLNDLVRQNTHGYTNADHQNVQTLSAVAGQLHHT